MLIGREERVVLSECVSDWQRVLSGVSQDSAWRPLLFFVFVNDLDDGILKKYLKFADDARLFGKTDNDDCRETLSEDLQLLSR